MSAPNDDEEFGPVAWDVAERVARQSLRLVPPIDVATLRSLDEDFREATRHAEVLVERATGLHSNAAETRASVTDRAGWVEANIGSFRRLLRPLVERLAKTERRSLPGMGPAARIAAGVEAGLVLSWMSGRVLGQYDLFPVDASENGDAVYYVGPNIAALEQKHGFDPKEFRLWIALHEVTHRMQFTGVPWMKEYFLGLVEKGMQLSPPDTKTVLASLSRAVSEIRAGRNPLADGGAVALLATSDQLATLHEVQALMSLLEGHGDVIMARAGADEIPGASRFAEVLAQRRANTKGFAKVFQQVIGIDAKIRQYEEGEKFVEAVERAGGDELLAKVWIGPEMLPTLEEVRAPKIWIDRVSKPARSSG